nr:hypothetical protein GCM10020092_014590 [Actinoplanes digitatis]
MRRNVAHCPPTEQLRGVVQRVDDPLGVAAGECEHELTIEHEVEEHVYAVGGAARVAEELLELVRLGVRLGEQDRVAVAPLHVLAQVGEELQVLARVRVARLGLLDDERHGVHPEAGDAELEPERADLLDLGADLRVLDVEVRLEVVEPVVEPLLRGAVVAPGLGLLAGEDHALAPVRRRAVGPDVPVAVGRVRRRAGRPEPRMPVGGVVDDQVDDHPDAQVPGLVQELGEVAEGAEARIDVVEVLDVVTVVAVGGSDGSG